MASLGYARSDNSGRRPQCPPFIPKPTRKLSASITTPDGAMNKQVIGSGLTVAVLTCFMTGLGFDQLSSAGLQWPGYVALGILFIAAILWVSEAVPLFVTSLLVLFLAIVWLLPNMKSAGIDANRDMFLSPFFSDVIVLFLGGFSLSSALHKHQLDEFLASRIIKRTGTSLPKLLFGIMAVTAFLSMWLSNTATAAMMLAMVLPIASRLGDDDLRGKAILLAVPFAANVGGLGTPIGSPPNAIAMQYMADQGIAPSFAQWLVIGVPGVICMLFLAWGVLLFLYGGNGKKLPEIKRQVELKIDHSFWIILTVVGVTTAGWMTTSLHGLSTGTVALVPVLAFFGFRVLSIADLKSMSWEVLLMMGGGLCLGTIIAQSGLADWMVAQIPVQGYGTFLLTALFGGVACMMSSVMSNTATANLLFPIIVGLGVDPISPMMIGTAFGCSLAMPLPVSTPPNAMAFSSGKINVADLAKPGLVLTVVGVTLALTTGYWWWEKTGIW